MNKDKSKVLLVLGVVVNVGLLVAVVAAAGVVVWTGATLLEEILAEFSLSATKSFESPGLVWLGGNVLNLVKTAAWVGAVWALAGMIRPVRRRRFVRLVLAAIVVVLGIFTPWGPLCPLLVPVGLLAAYALGVVAFKTNVLIIGRRELTSLFFSPIAYLVLTGFLVLEGVGFIWGAAELESAAQMGFPNIAPLGFTLGNFITIFSLMIVMPVITMRMVAQEKQSGTLEMLMTHPVKDWHLAAGKFLGVLGFYAAMWAAMFVHVLILNSVSNLDWGQVASCYIGLLLVGMMYVSVGLFFSSVTRNQVAAAVFTFVVIFLTVIVMIFTNWIRRSPNAAELGWLLDAAGQISLFNHLSMTLRGTLDSRSVFFFCSTAGLFGFLSVQAISARRWGDFDLRRHISGLNMTAAVAGLLLVAAAAAGLGWWKDSIVAGIYGALATAVVVGVLLARLWSGSWANRLVYGVNVFVCSAAAVLLTIMVNYLAVRHHKAWDFTRDRTFTLSERTEEVFKATVEDGYKIEAIGLIPETKIPLDYRQYNDNKRYRRLRSQFKIFADAVNKPGNTKFEFEFVDPFADPDKTALLKNKYNVAGYREVILTYKNKSHILRDTDIFKLTIPPEIAMRLMRNPMMRPDMVPDDLKDPQLRDDFEYHLTSAVLQLIEGEKAKIYFAAGHGEKDIFSHNPQSQSAFGRLRELLTSLNFDVRSIDLTKKSQVPDDCKVLIIAGPKYRFSQRSVGAVEGYLRQSGRVMILLEHNTDAALAGLLKRYGIKTETAVATAIADTVLGRMMIQDVEAGPAMGQGGPHKLVRGLVGKPGRFMTVRIVEPARQGPRRRPGRAVTSLFSAPKGYWAETDLHARQVARDGSERVAPFSFAAISEAAKPAPPMRPGSRQPPPPPAPAEKGYKLLVFGDADFASNAMIRDGINKDLAINAVGYLAGKSALVTEAVPKSEKRKTTRFEFDLKGRWNGIYLITLLLLPGGVLVLGVLVWIARRSV